MQISKEFIASVSANEAAVKNGLDLFQKKKFTKLMIDKEQTLLTGECQGSGKKPYLCSADFMQEGSPVFRCSCPSRQLPCKHVIGLMWAYEQGQAFETAEVPEDIVNKRENKEKRAEKAREKAKAAEAAMNNEETKDGTDQGPAPKEKSAAWKKSAVKKIDAQLTGIGEAEKILTAVTAAGFGSLDAKNISEYQALVKQLDSYAIAGIQNEINDWLGMARAYNTGGPKEQKTYLFMAEKLCRIHTLLAKSKAYFEKKKEAPDKPDTQSEIEELTGYAWKLDELLAQGLFETDARLVQLCFHVRREEEKKQLVEEGFYISLQSGRLYKTRNYRPFKAARYIREEDSVFRVLSIPRLHIYPSLSLNPRVRWEENTLTTFEALLPADYQQIRAHAAVDYGQVVKQVKNQLKNLLLFPHPAILVHFARLSKRTAQKAADEAQEGAGMQDQQTHSYVLHDASGQMLCLKKSRYFQDSFMFLLDRLTGAEAAEGVMLLLFDNNIETGELTAQPLALVTAERVIRLVY